MEAVCGPIERHRFASGESVLDWTVPDEWTVSDAWVKDSRGQTVISLADSNLHLVSYSAPVHTRMPLSALQRHLHSLPEQPDAIPYRTSYYHRSWGFCIADRARRELADGEYEVLVDSRLQPGHLEVGEVTVPGASDREVLISTYCCHPSMANNELSGPVVTAALARMLREREQPPRFTYRFLFGPETIGSIAYLSRFGERLRRRLDAGLIVTCVGADAPFTYRRSRRGGTLIDRAVAHVLGHSDWSADVIDFYPPRSDERQYCSPGFDLPVGCLSRGGFDDWPEYHTSLDDLTFITPDALGESFELNRRIIAALESNETFRATVLDGEPQLGRRGLYPATGGGWNSESDRSALEDMMFLLNFCDGGPDLLAAAERSNRPIAALRATVDELRRHDLLRVVDRETPE